MVFDQKTMDWLNHMVRTEEGPDVPIDDAIRFRTAIAILIKFLTEENQAPIPSLALPVPSHCAYA